MKTAVNIPDDLFARAEQLASSKGYTRSELSTRAILFYLETGASAEQEKIEKINAMVEDLGPEAFGVSEAGRGALNQLSDEGW